MVENEVVHDMIMSVVSSVVALFLLRFWKEMAKLGVEKKLNRKFVHISIGMVFMLFWPFFSSGIQAPFLAALTPGLNIFRMLLMGFGILKDEAMVRSMSRNGHYSELLKGPLYYACTITLCTILYWRTSSIGMAAICNLCAGDGVADIIGRRYGKEKLPYNREKSFAGSFAMGISGFLASIMYMHYFSMFGLIEESWSKIIGFFFISLASTIMESLPISSQLDDNLTVPLTACIVGTIIF
ncbi:putative phytol kinase 2, chloroplastic [Zostera marina]|uniref:Putative phytol kinase 2, chloroplastic n=1 Tax=Zostera marina TaxID=29655 RepID=A0A0K9PGE0_ZOSMR|nr:putative phytol kinase 2, chloroplastic [Zostera marina]